jgi:outer membrane immunogenic protein
MKKIFLTSVALAVLGAAPAFAADLAGRPYTKAPMVEQAASWTGFYLGGHVGAGWNSNSFTNANIPDFEDFGLPFGSGTANGMLGGFQGGFNYQIAPKLVIGIEGEYSFADIKGDTTAANGEFGGYTVNAKQRNIAAVTGKVGTVYHDDILIYAKAGWAWSQFRYNTAVNFNEGPDGIGSYPSVTDNRSGFTFGVGTEYKIDRNWSAKVEYDYYDFGTKNVAFPTGSVVFGDPLAAFNADVSQQTHVVKVGANYTFGGY